MDSRGVVRAEWNLPLSLEVKKFLTGNFIFIRPYIMKYLSDLDEKWMVREVEFWSFRGVSWYFDGLVVLGLMKS